MNTEETKAAIEKVAAMIRAQRGKPKTNPLYSRLVATGYSAEIKRGHVGWRFYLLDPQGQRVSLGKQMEELPRTGSESVAAVNARLKGKRGFRKDSRFNAVLEAFVEHCEGNAGQAVGGGQ